MAKQEVRRISLENDGKLSFEELEKRVNKHPSIKIVEPIPTDNPEIIDFNKKHLGFEIYQLVNGKVVRL